MSRVFILPHPGKERVPSDGTNRVGWGSDPHKRKFLQATGEWRTIDGNSGAGTLQFWGEYEAPSFVRPVTRAGAGLPRFVQTVDPHVYDGGVPLNSDPWVFGPSFVWTICRYGPVRDTVVAGDIVLFGSLVESAWVLDTVLVADAPPAPAQPGAFGVEYDLLVRPTVEGATPIPGRTFRAIDRPFSFAPALPVDGRERPFPRPRVDALFSMLRKCNGGARPSAKNAYALTPCVSSVPLAKFWTALLEFVSDTGCVLGTHFIHPGVQREGGEAQKKNICTPRSARAAC